MYWQEEIRNNVTDISQLTSSLGLTDEETRRLSGLLEHYPMSIPRYYLSLIDFRDPDDPIRKMCVPGASEFARPGRGSKTYR